MISLGVNIDHVATLRNARGTIYPSLPAAAAIAEQNGGDFITVHLREDRRHIKDQDLFILKDTVSTYINLEMACNEDVLSQALKARPYKTTLVPERREEVTTEGGLDVINNLERVTEYTRELQKAGIIVSLFIEAKLDQLEAFIKTGAREIEIHTGKYADSKPHEWPGYLAEFQKFTEKATEAGLKVCAGHGLNYHNTHPICKIKGIQELNIGHSIIGQAVFTGLGQAVRDMKNLIRDSE